MAIEEVVVLGHVVIAFDGELVLKAVVGVVETIPGGVQSIADGGVVGSGEERKELLNRGIDAEVQRIDAFQIHSLSGAAVGGLVEEKTLERSGRRDRAYAADGGVRSGALVIAEDEQLVVFDGASEGSAEDVSDEDGLRRADGVVEEIAGIENRVTQIVEGSSMILVGAGACDQLHLSAGVAAVFGF